MSEIVLFSIVILIIILLIASNLRKTKEANLFSSVSLSFLFYYTIIPLIIYIVELKVPMGIDAYLGGMDRHIYLLIVIIAYFIFYIFYSKPYTKNTFDKVVNFNKLSMTFKKVGYFSIVIGGISLTILFISLGGLASALQVAEQARSFSSNNVESFGVVARLITPAKFIILSPYCFLFLFLKTHRLIYKRLLLLSFCGVLLFYLFDASRSSLMIFLVPFIFPILRKFTNHPWLLIIVGGILCINLLNVLDALFIYFETGEYTVAELEIINLLPQFWFPYGSLVNIINILEAENIRYGLDFITTWLNYIPGLTFEQSYEPISRFWGGEEWRTFGGTPSDFISFSILEFHFLGLIIIPAIWGRLLRKIDDVLDTIKRQASDLFNFVIVFKSYLILLVFFYIPSFDFCAIVAGYSVVVFFYILINKVF